MEAKMESNFILLEINGDQDGESKGMLGLPFKMVLAFVVYNKFLFCQQLTE
jgi:hypothetical protein